MWKDIFVKRKYATVKINQSNPSESVTIDEIDEDIFTRCPSCNEVLINMELVENLQVCSKCGHHFRLDSIKRFEITFDCGTVNFMDADMRSCNPLDYPGYTEKLKGLARNVNINEGVITGTGKIDDMPLCFGIMDWRFIMGSMGSVVGEKLSRMVERAVELELPVVIFSVSGGARMQEGMLSLSQMSKVSAALKRHSNKGLLYISILTDPTTGGVTASFASLGDIIIAEPGATIGFAGKRVIEQTIRQSLPQSFQSSEFLLDHGFIDMIVERKNMKSTLGRILKLHGGGIV